MPEQKLKLSIYGYRQMCITHNLFTCGSNEQYAKAFRMCEENRSFHDLAVVTWICSESDKFPTINSVEELIKKYARAESGIY